jgi:sec-independent protein translocase protein TatA
MPFGLGGPELIIVLVIVLIVFGAGRLPSVMRDFGSGVRAFRQAQVEDLQPAGPTPPAPEVAPGGPSPAGSDRQP